ncbi:MAG: tetratricopeptide repeat protein, partial [Blastocatellia bacterium]
MRRTRKTISAVMLLALSAPVSAFSQHHAEDAATSQARLIEGLGNLHHRVTTKNPEAQRWFDQGLSLVYAFNHEEAIRSFKHAAELDPSLAMAHWGAALALGPNYNADVDPGREKAAYDEIQKAVALEPKVSVHERAYIKALSIRYTDTPNPDLSKLAHAYSAAMREVARRYPDDPDAGVLYAESMMDLNPWKLWGLDGTPAAGTLEIVSTLESVLKKFPQHIGANHLYIHAVEASPNPERALPNARRLAALSPAAGHLVHMPAHIFIRTGDYNASTLSNMAAAAVDRSYLAAGAAGPMYPLMYYSHNLQFLVVSSAIQGNFARAVKAVDELEKNVQQRGGAMPLMADWTGPTRALILVRFARWNEVLNLTEPNKFLPITHALYHFARGVALANTGKLPEAAAELDTLSREGDAMAPGVTLGFN